MPIVVKDFTWSEDDTEVNIVVPLKGVRPSKADIYSNELYIKVGQLRHGQQKSARVASSLSWCQPNKQQ
jgi:hypothetical protein